MMKCFDRTAPLDLVRLVFWAQPTSISQLTLVPHPKPSILYPKPFALNSEP
jgi:hypothetical protein